MVDQKELQRLQEAIEKRKEALKVSERLAESELKRLEVNRQNKLTLDEETASYNRKLALVERNLSTTRDLLDLQSRLLAIQEDDLNKARESSTLSAAEVRAKQETLAAARAELETDMKNYLLDKKRLGTKRQLQSAAENMRSSTREMLGLITGITDQSNTWLGSLFRADLNLKGIGDRLKIAGKTIVETTTFTNTLGSATQSIIASTTLMIAKWDQLSVGFRTATGAGEAYIGRLESISNANRHLGISLAENESALRGLYSSMSAFTTLTPQVGNALSSMVAKMQHVGISAEQSSQNLDHMTRAFGMGIGQAKQFSLDMVRLGTDIGIPPQRLARDLATLTPRLALYGKTAEEQFRRLAAQSKATGVAMQQLIGISRGFDTFEAAAEKVGSLNAILGGPYMDTVTMMMATESERIRIIKESVSSSGRLAEITSRAGTAQGRFLIQAIATKAGIQDVSTLTRILTNDLDAFSGQALSASGSIAGLNKQASDNTTIQQRAAIINEQLAMNAKDLASAINRVLLVVNNLGNGFGGLIIPLLAVNTGISIATRTMGFASTGWGKLTGLFSRTSKDVSQAAAVTSGLASQTENLKEVSKGASGPLRTLGSTGRASGAGLSAGAKGMLAFGGAIAAIGAGIGAATYGISKLAESIKGMQPNEISALTSVLKQMFGAFAAGAGILGVAAAAFTVFPGLMIGAKLAAAALVIVLGALTIGLFGLSLAIHSMPENKLESLATILRGLTVGAGGAAQSIAAIGPAVKQMMNSDFGAMVRTLNSVTASTSKNAMMLARALSAIGRAAEEMPTSKLISIKTSVEGLKSTINAVVRLEQQPGNLKNTVRLAGAARTYSQAVARSQNARDPLERLISAIKTGGGLGGTGGGGPIHITMDLNDAEFGKAILRHSGQGTRYNVSLND